MSLDESESFGAAAARLCGAASLMLGWRPTEFWDSTPAELAVALQGLGGVSSGPDAQVLDDLRRRFPDG